MSTTISGLASTAKTRTGMATTLAVASGAEMPRNCGSSSPKTIENTVAMSRARAAETGLERLVLQAERAERAVCSSRPRLGVAM